MSANVNNQNQTNQLHYYSNQAIKAHESKMETSSATSPGKNTNLDIQRAGHPTDQQK